MSSISYHLAELEIVRSDNDARRSVPAFSCDGWKVLDVGCGIGQQLAAREFVSCAERHGIDIDRTAIEYGRAHFTGVHLEVGRAEQIPYDADSFDLTFSRVALPYSNVPTALREIFRVTKPGGRIWLSLHSWGKQTAQWRQESSARSLGHALDVLYVTAHSLMLNYGGWSMRRPWSGTYESFQFPGGTRRLLERSGFTEVEIEYGDRFIVTARKPLAGPAGG